MHVHGRLVSIPVKQALDWSKESLDQGSHLARQAAGALDREPIRAYAILPQDGAAAPLSEFSQSARIGDADRILGETLTRLSELAGILVVDDDLARRGDPGLDDASFVDDRVIRWLDIGSASNELTHLIRIGASGYPLNAFICHSEGGRAAGLSAGPLSRPDVLRLVSEVRVIIHSIFDAESFLFVVIDDGYNSIFESLTGPVASQTANADA
ncbi:hypothetical protein [Microbacterium sp. UBA3486]|uniref:hypothetical protein n=1 Tax=Microbacterium TaxID=33882 RepID=UPI0025FB7212|nr:MULTISPECIES: hypothetical protein [Microbacterium]